MRGRKREPRSRRAIEETMNHKRRRLLWLAMMGAGLPKPVAAALCRITEPNALGPFYRERAPFRSVLAAPSEPGEPLVITGRVLAADGCTPLSNAVVDAWHANARGRYYNVGDHRGDEPEEFRLRGRVATNENGQYRFDTIMPGSYSFRPRHVHLIATHPDAESLVTQMYFAGDPRLQRDPLVRESLVVEKQNESAVFDIVLRT